MKRLLIRVIKWGFILFCLLAGILFVSDLLIRQSTRDAVFSELEEVGCFDVALAAGISCTYESHIGFVYIWCPAQVFGRSCSH